MLAPLTDNFLTLWRSPSRLYFKSHFRCSSIMLRLCFLLNVIFIAFYCIPSSKAGLTMHNSLLNGHVFKTHVGIDWLSCVQECYKEVMCVSYNFFSPGEICELNNSGLKDPCNAGNKLISITGWIYHEIDALQVNIQLLMQISRFIARAKWYKIIFTFFSRIFLAFLFLFSKIIRWKIWAYSSHIQNFYFSVYLP